MAGDSSLDAPGEVAAPVPSSAIEGIEAVSAQETVSASSQPEPTLMPLLPLNQSPATTFRLPRLRGAELQREADRSRELGRSESAGEMPPVVAIRTG